MLNMSFSFDNSGLGFGVVPVWACVPDRTGVTGKPVLEKSLAS